MDRRAILLAALLVFALPVQAEAGPVTKVVALSPRYNAQEIDITWQTALTGGCTSSNLATTNGGASNHQALLAFLLAALTSGASVEVTFGGGCAAGGLNWIQTIKVVSSS